MDFPPRKGERRCDLFGENPLILLGLDSWLQLDFVQAEHLWHGKSSLLPTNHLCHCCWLPPARRKRVPKAATVDPDPPASPATTPAHGSFTERRPGRVGLLLAPLIFGLLIGMLSGSARRLRVRKACEGSLGFRRRRPHPLEGAVDGGPS